MTTPSDRGVTRVVHHKDYYLRGGDMVITVEKHQYCVHSFFFERESLFFRQMLAGSKSEGDEHGSTENSYTLEGVKSEDFSRFLWVFYNPTYSLYDAPLETWLSILGLATQWGFNNVKELCVRELEKLTIEAVEKIAIYHKHSISRLYLIPSYVDVVRRDKPLTLPEGMNLGMETVLRVADARERARQRASESGVRTPCFEDFDEAELDALVREVFGLSRVGSPSPGSATATAANGTTNGADTIKLNAPPRGHAAATPAPKTNGVSNSFDGIRSFGTAMGAQASTGGTPAVPANPPPTVAGKVAVPTPKVEQGTGSTKAVPPTRGTVGDEKSNGQPGDGVKSPLKSTTDWFKNL